MEHEVPGPYESIAHTTLPDINHCIVKDPEPGIKKTDSRPILKLALPESYIRADQT
jgi:hypothetical protein